MKVSEIGIFSGKGEKSFSGEDSESECRSGVKHASVM